MRDGASVSLGAPNIYDAIVAAHAAPEWAVFAEVGDATGGRASRRADALAINLWPSRGLEIRGFEIKVSRSDLKRELEDPSKAEAVGVFCHTWCLATPVGLVRAEDMVPTSWGLFEVSEGAPFTGRFKRLPTQRPAEEVKPPSRLFVAAIVRAACAEIDTMRTSHAWVRRENMQAELDKEFQRGLSSAPNEHGVELRDLKAELARVRPILVQLGIDTDSTDWKWSGGSRHTEALKIGLSLVKKYGAVAPENTLRDIERALDGLKEARAAVRRLLPKEDKPNAS